MRYVFPVNPMAKPRQTSSDRWKKRPVVVRYRAWCDAMRAFAAKQGFELPESGFSLTFYIPMPKSWSKKKKREMESTPHLQKPDIDNLTKAVLDCFLGDDSGVWHIDGLTKYWSREGQLVVNVGPNPIIDWEEAA